MKYNIFIIISFIIAILASSAFGLNDEGKAFIVKSAKHDIKYILVLKDIVKSNPANFTEYKEDLDVFFDIVTRYCGEMIVETNGQARERKIRALVHIIGHSQNCISDIFKVCGIEMPHTEDI